ncbi:EAL domain-containing protein [Bacillus sp. BRMEA1]|uniref:EAL domain-containing protein n=1 Tax=Neobacillus endophyticus TaxID=2738405 RepID=UPI001565DB87|nr:EAL domain-containing protein [Neobacillus endophyticus]NRD76647.1 EAL domain-containing protein [Neobacillus endophyticus]
MEQTFESLLTYELLKKALINNEFRLHYQPKLDLTSGEIFGVEALIRWEHPQKGIVSPSEFIPFAEETGMILQIGEWVLRTVCQQNKIWQEGGLSPIVMAVNLSASQLYQNNLVQMVQHIIEESGLSPECLELEITESMMMDVQKVLPILRDLKRLGVRISLDDFGTGYSSLSYLKEFPIDIIKIDRSFVQNCTMDTKDATIVKTIIAMAHQLKIEVIAEGVESKDHLIFLQQHLCNSGQGYFFSRPLPSDEFVQKFNYIQQIIQREGIPQNISRQKWLEQELEDARQELRDTLRQQQGMIIKFIQRDGKFIHTLCDGELLYRIGLTPEKLIGKELFDILPKDEAERKLQYYKRAWEGEENVYYEGKLNGIWYLESLRPIRRGGQVIEVIGSCVDVTERKESEERYRKVVEYSPKGIVIHREGKILYANPSALKIAKENNIAGKSVYDYIHPDFHKISKQRIFSLEKGAVLPKTEVKLVLKDGEVIDIEIGAVGIPYNGSTATLALYSDITDKKKMEQELEESKERYERLLNLSPEPIVVHSQGKIKYINQAGAEILGFNQPKELFGKSPLDFFHTDSLKHAIQQMQRLSSGKENQVEILECKMVKEDGTIFFVECKAMGIIYDGEPAIQGIFRDITARKQVEEALRQSEGKYRLIAENMQDLIVVIDTKGVFQYASPSHKRVLGLSPEFYEGKVSFNFVHPDDISQIQEKHANMVATKTPCYMNFRCQHANGGWVYLESCTTPVLDENNEIKHLIVVARDISERLKN